MQGLVNERMVETAMDPVDAQVRKHQEERKLNVVICAAEDRKHGVIEVVNVVVDEAVVSDFSDEEWEGEDCHYWH